MRLDRSCVCRRLRCRHPSNIGLNIRSLRFQLQFSGFGSETRSSAAWVCVCACGMREKRVLCVCVVGACSLGLAAFGPRSPIPPTGIRPCLLPTGPSYRLPSVADGSRRRASRNRGCISHSKCSKCSRRLRSSFCSSAPLATCLFLEARAAENPRERWAMRSNEHDAHELCGLSDAQNGRAGAIPGGTWSKPGDPASAHDRASKKPSEAIWGVPLGGVGSALSKLSPP